MCAAVLRRTQCKGVALAADDQLMVLVPAGEYLGLGADEPAEARPLHEADVPAFWIAAYPVTIAMYAQHIAQSGYDAGIGPDRGADGLLDILARLYNTPFALGLTYFEADAYARIYGLRLPNESEWEIAMRMTNRNGDAKQRADAIDACIARPSGILLSPFGCAILAQEFAEWTSDKYDSYRGGLRRRHDPTAGPVGLADYMSVRGQAPLRNPSPILRRPLEADKTRLGGISLAFRCVVYADDVVLRD